MTCNASARLTVLLAERRKPQAQCSTFVNARQPPSLLLFFRSKLGDGQKALGLACTAVTAARPSAQTVQMQSHRRASWIYNQIRINKIDLNACFPRYLSTFVNHCMLYGSNNCTSQMKHFAASSHNAPPTDASRQPRLHQLFCHPVGMQPDGSNAHLNQLIAQSFDANIAQVFKAVQPIVSEPLHVHFVSRTNTPHHRLNAGRCSKRCRRTGRDGKRVRGRGSDWRWC